MNIDMKEFWEKREDDLQEELNFNRNNPVSRRDWLIHQLSIIDRNVLNENKVVEMEAELKQIERAESEAKELAFSSEWTKEVTMQRRAEWNARVRAGEFNAKPGKPTVVQVKDAEKAQGWRTEDLKKAISKWSL